MSYLQKHILAAHVPSKVHSILSDKIFQSLERRQIGFQLPVESEKLDLTS